MLLVPTCPVCLRRGSALCGECAGALRPAAALPPPPGVDRCLALLDYGGAGRELVARLKYRNLRTVLPRLAVAMASLLATGPPVDALTWAPTAPGRRRRRGFDQAELLARRVGPSIGTPARALLRRRPGHAQTGRTLAERRAGPAFDCAVLRVHGHVVVVDDVVTSGATATAAARALTAAGATRVTLLAAARTALKRPHHNSDTLRDETE